MAWGWREGYAFNVTTVQRASGPLQNQGCLLGEWVALGAAKTRFRRLGGHQEGTADVPRGISEPDATAPARSAVCFPSALSWRSYVAVARRPERQPASLGTEKADNAGNMCGSATDPPSRQLLVLQTPPCLQSLNNETGKRKREAESTRILAIDVYEVIPTEGNIAPRGPGVRHVGTRSPRAPREPTGTGVPGPRANHFRAYDSTCYRFPIPDFKALGNLTRGGVVGLARWAGSLGWPPRSTSINTRPSSHLLFPTEGSQVGKSKGRSLVSVSRKGRSTQPFFGAARRPASPVRLSRTATGHRRHGAAVFSVSPGERLWGNRVTSKVQ